MTDIYEKVSDYFLELASLQRLNILFKLLERNRKRIEPLAKELGATKQEVHRNLIRLEASGLITKEKNGKYGLTTFGKTMCVEIPSILFLSQHNEYFQDHDFGSIPLKFVMRAGQLATGSHIKGITKTLQKWKSVYSNANEYICEILSEIPEELFENERNRLGGLLLLKGKDNISSNNEPYKDKLKTYANTLYWNETLREDTYKSKLDFKNLLNTYELEFEPYNQFGKEELEKRHKLLFKIIKIIWCSNPSL